MLKGLRFFLQQGWKYDKKYILWRVIYQFVHALIPILAALAPKYILDELAGQQRIPVLLTYVGILVTYTLIAGIVSNCLSLDSYTRRGYVSTAFNTDLNRHLTRTDFERLESPAFREMKEKAEKFIFCDWHGFGYLLDMSLNIVGKCITLMGIATIILTLNPWVVLLFVALCLVSTWVGNRAEQKAKALSYQIVSQQRHVMYYMKVFDDTKIGKEIRLNGLGDWLVERYADEQRIEALLRQVGLGRKLDSLPKGLHTHVTKLFEEDGFEPSGGEGQKIALARALYRNASMMVLDEPTAALDPRAEYEIYRQFDRLTEGKSTVYISHRLASTRFCHKVAVFHKGTLVEWDTHQTLMGRGGYYAQLFNLQAQAYLD